MLGMWSMFLCLSGSGKSAFINQENETNKKRINITTGKIIIKEGVKNEFGFI